MDLGIVGIWLCHIPTLNHYDRFSLGGIMTGGNMLGNHDDDDDDGDDDDDDLILWMVLVVIITMIKRIKKQQ